MRQGEAHDREVALAWHAGVARVPMEGFQRWALTLWKAHLPFDHALWGLGAGVQGDGRAHINSIHLYCLPPQLMVDYEAVRHCDPLARETTARPGQVISLSLTDPQWQTDVYAPLLAHGARYGLIHVLCLAMSDAGTGTHQFITLARPAAAARYSESERDCFERLAPHAMQAFSNRRALHLAMLSPAETSPDRPWATAIVDRQGTVHDRDAGFTAMLQREWPSWQGPKLPAALLDPTHRQAGQGAEFLGQRLKAELTPVNDLYLLAIRPRVGSDLLSARERAVALRYAAGDTYRVIAEQLGLAPSTVRAHLRSVFSKLGAHNKVEVAARLRG